MNHYITTNSPENHSYFPLYQKGEQIAFTYIYEHLYKPVLYYANRITGDEFANHTIVQEDFLRAWQFRERMTSMLHLFRFIRLCTRWGCYDYFRQPATRFYRQLVHPEYLEDDKAAAYDPDNEEKLAGFSNIVQERINPAKDAIPHLKTGLMQKSTYIKEKVAEVASFLLPLGISHITIYITGSRDLFSPALPISHLPSNDGEIFFLEMKNDWALPIIVIFKADSI